MFAIGKVISNLFRTRETDSDDEDLTNVVGLQPEGSLYPTVTDLRVEPGEITAKVFWKQPECFPDYELQIVNIKDCETGSYEVCLAEFSAGVEETTEKKTHFHEFGDLEPCTEYVAMARTTGREIDNFMFLCNTVIAITNINSKYKVS